MKVNKIIIIVTTFLGAFAGAMLMVRFMPSSTGQTYWSKLQQANAATNVKAVTFIFGHTCPTGMTNIATAANAKFIMIDGSGAGTGGTPTNTNGDINGNGGGGYTTNTQGSHQHGLLLYTGAGRWFGDDNGDNQFRNAVEAGHSHTATPPPYIKLKACVWDN